MLSDIESQKIFSAKAHLAQTNDLSILIEFLMKKEQDSNRVDVFSLFRDKINNTNTNEFVLYGTTPSARNLFLAIQKLKIKIDYICIEDDLSLFSNTSSLKNEDWSNTPMITENEMLIKHKDADILIGDVDCGATYKYLLQKGLRKLWYSNSLLGQQYFDFEFFKPHDHEIFVDGGAFNLDSTKDFIEWCYGKYDSIYVFEPVQTTYDLCKKRIKTEEIFNKEKIEIYKAALWEKDEDIKFKAYPKGHEDSSKVDQNGELTMPGKSIDSTLQDEHVTFIKMDIEGSELSALKGAAQSIKKWKPRLAICIYHKPEDITEIPLYIHNLVPEYRMYIRHYSTSQNETVLYCCI